MVYDIIAVHPYSQYVPEEYADIKENVEESANIYMIEDSTRSSAEPVGNFYDETIMDVSGNGFMASNDLDILDSEDIVVTGGMCSQCMPSAVESLLREDYEPVVDSSYSFERINGKKTPLSDLNNDSDLLRNLYYASAEIDDVL